MNIAYKKREEDKDVAKYKILRVHKVAYLVLVATVLLFVMSIVLSISEADALRAYQDNISALALAAKGHSWGHGEVYERYSQCVFHCDGIPGALSGRT